MTAGWLAGPTLSLTQVKRNFIQGNAGWGGGSAKLPPLDLPQGVAAAPCRY